MRSEIQLMYYAVETTDTLRLHVFEAPARCLEEQAQACESNEEGYQTQEVADRVGRRMRALIAQGYTHRADDVVSAKPFFEVVWSRHQGRYIAPRVNVGADYRRLHVNLRLADRVHARMHRGRVRLARDIGRAFKSPEDTIAALDALRAVRGVSAPSNRALVRSGNVSGWYVDEERQGALVLGRYSDSEALVLYATPDWDEPNTVPLQAVNNDCEVVDIPALEQLGDQPIAWTGIEGWDVRLWRGRVAEAIAIVVAWEQAHHEERI